jgi:hypothetical protein
MNCFKHNDVHAIGICKACGKAICLECAIDTGNGIACSEICVKEVNEINQVVQKSKNIYGIGSENNKNLIPSGVLPYLFFAILFLGWSSYEYLAQARTNSFLLVMGCGFAIMSVVTYFRAKKMSINC